MSDDHTLTGYNSNTLQKVFSASQIAQTIDHTLLKPDAPDEQFKQLCEEAVEYGFFSVCVPLVQVARCREWLHQTAVHIVTVIGFPSGSEATAVKVQQTREAITLGAYEIDMVLNRTLLQAHQYASVATDVSSVVQAARGHMVKVILETSELNEDQKAIGCALSVLAGAGAVKTSTGFSSAGAKTADVRKLRQLVPITVGVKASGGIRTYDDACSMLSAGATRLGTSKSVEIIKQAEAAHRNQSTTPDPGQ